MLGFQMRKREWFIYLKAVKLKKDLVVAIEAIEPAANKHWNNLKNRPVNVPGVPAKFFILIKTSQTNNNNKNPIHYQFKRRGIWILGGEILKWKKSKEDDLIRWMKEEELEVGLGEKVQKMMMNWWW